MEILFAPIQPFVCHPERALYVALFFAVFWMLHRKYLYSFRSRPLIFAAIAWLIYGIWEAFSCAYNIRVDLLLIYPALLVITIYASYQWLKLKEPNQ